MCKGMEVGPTAVMSDSSLCSDVPTVDTMQRACELLNAANQMQEAAQQAMRAADHARRSMAAPTSPAFPPMPKYRRWNWVRPPLEPIIEEIAAVADFGNVGCFVQEDGKTLVLQSLPFGYTQEMLVDLLDSEGFAGRYEFAQLPLNCQYGVVRLVTCDDAESARAHFSDFDDWTMDDFDDY